MAEGVRPAAEAAGSPWTFLFIAAGTVVGLTVLGLNLLVTVLSGALEIAFLVYFARHMSFAMAALRGAPGDLHAPLLDTGYRPSVTVMVACKNEESVVEGLVTSLLRLDYEPRLLEVIIINDGSTDRTAELLDGWARREPRVRVVHRAPGEGGGKSGALNEGLAVASGEIIIIFDADHQPHRDVLRRLTRHFEDPAVGAVQGRCVIRNPGDSMLTRLVAVDYLAGYLVNEYGRQGMFELPAYGGANCAVRACDLRAAGGWNVATVTEDTDLTLRLVLAGRRVRYDVTAVDEEEGVVSVSRYWRQRYRWARGHQQVWRDYRRQVWRSRELSIMAKVETSMFLLAFHLPMASGLGLGLLALWSTHAAQPSNPLNTLVLWTLLFLGPLLEMGAGLLIAQSDRREAIALVLFLPLFFVSIALCTKAWFDGVAGRPYAWVKTARSDDPVGAT